MKRKYENERYIYDPLYGVIYLPSFIWDIIPCPELQRLREVRLCNINSFCLTGGASINRYEHAIGTCYLAQECLNSWPPLNPINKEEQEHFSLAALLHDRTNAAFGHSVEYVESEKGFDHEKAFEEVGIGEKEESYPYKSATLESIFFGMQREIPKKISEEDLEAIGKIIAGKGRFGPLINGSIDLDNIDNVFRLAYHIGIAKSGEVPLKLAKSLWIENYTLIVRKEAVSLIEEWHTVRRKLYSLLLLNPEEFSAKCMLTEAIELAKIKDRYPFTWKDVDYEFLQRLYTIPPVRVPVRERLFTLDRKFEDGLNKSIITKELQVVFKKHGIDISPSATIETKGEGWKIQDKTKEYFIVEKNRKLIVFKVGVRGSEISKIVWRLMKGDLYGCIGIFSTTRTNKYGIFTDAIERRQLEHELSEKIRCLIMTDQLRLFDELSLHRPSSLLKSAMIAFHPILDVDKTERQVQVQTDEGEVVKIGNSSNQLLIGVFFKNMKLDMYGINNLPHDAIKRIRREISTYLSSILEDQNLKEVELYGEIRKYQ